MGYKTSAARCPTPSQSSGDLWLADITCMNDQFGALQGLDGFGTQQPVSIGNDADDVGLVHVLGLPALMFLNFPHLLIRSICSSLPVALLRSNSSHRMSVPPLSFNPKANVDDVLEAT